MTMTMEQYEGGKRTFRADKTNDILKNQNKYRRKKPFWTKPRIITFMVAAIVLCLLFAPIFYLKDIDVEGNQYTKTERIRETASVSLGVSIFRINLSKVKDRVARRNPYVENAKVVRKYPNRILITVKEREPVYQIAFNGSYVLLSNQNIPLEVLPKMKENLPLLKGVEFQSFLKGQPLQAKSPLTNEAAKACIDELTKNGLKDKLTILNVTQPERIWLRIGNYLSVDLGGMDKLAYKIKFLKEVIDKTPVGEKATVIIDSNGTVTYQPGE